ncbi:hypothetical protein ACWZHB_19470 [Nocardia sp. FBN12]|uniref:hypothetical protein n=1 Tax=Nocardia sp. FBN12 TaxID=3419766 RepID=UPI003D091174
MISSGNALRSTLESRDRKRIQAGHPTHDDVHAYLRSAVLALYRDERELIESTVHEQTLAFRIGLRLANSVERPDNRLRVDTEYNRQGTRSKTIRNSGPIGERPDLVIHVRGNDESNLLAVEIKKSAKNIKDDLQKLRQLHSDQFNYHDTVLLILDDAPRWQWIRSDPGLTDIPFE